MGSLAKGINQANYLTCQESNRGLFVTLFYNQLNPVTGDITYVNAGHNPALHYQSATDSLKQLTTTGIPIGIDRDFAYQQNHFTMEAGDFLIGYNDGVTEAIDANNEEFGMQRLMEVVGKNKQATAPAIADAVEKAVNDFSPDGKQFDDITILVIKCNVE